MDEPHYQQQVTAAFKQLLAALDQVDPDLLDVESTGDMITVTASRGEKCIVNTQRAVQQLWVAGQSQGVHFSYEEKTGQWHDDKGKGLELYRFVADCVEAISGVRPGLR